MPRIATSALLALMLLIAPAAHAHHGAPSDPRPPVFRLEKVSERVWCLFGRGGNVGIYVTGGGVVVVDDQYEDMAQGIVDQIRTLTAEPVRYLVNTHYHADHTGGNAVFLKMGEVVAHRTVRPRLLEYPGVVKRTFPGLIEEYQREKDAIADPADAYRLALDKDLGLLKFFLDSAGAFTPESAAPPGLTYEGRVTLWVGGRPVEVMHISPAHTDGDSIVWIPEEKVVHMGDLLFYGMYPFVDTLGGGSVEGMVRSIDAVLAMVPPDAKVIAGHGPVTDLAGLRRARSFLADLHGKVRLEAEKGTSRADAVRRIRMDEYPDIKPSFRTLGNVIAAAYDELAPAR
jgi:glyoxylase-like metal-dependent hydrolase (beta-lactamase superfamily II)